MIYLVGRVARQGSSMMMRALHEGGMRIHPKSGAPMSRFGAFDPTYDPAPDGMYEVDWNNYRDVDQDQYGRWVRAFEGLVVKCSPYDLLRLDPETGPYQVIIMHRNFDEVRASHQRAFGHPIPEQDLIDLEMVGPILEIRPDCTVNYVEYTDVIRDPVGTFRQLRDDGWPIDPDIAAGVVNPALYRNRVA